MKSPDFSRRRFLQGAALLSAPLILPGRVWSQATAPSKRLNVGCIGMGKQMHGHVGNLLPRDDVQIVAVCDVDTTRREDAKRRVEAAYAKKAGTGSAAPTANLAATPAGGTFGTVTVSPCVWIVSPRSRTTARSARMRKRTSQPACASIPP